MALARTLSACERRWPSSFSVPFDADVDIYASSMASNFNWVHELIYPRFFKKINVEAENLEDIRQKMHDASVVYVTKNIGQLEYNFFNYFFVKEGLPLARFVNRLSLWQWLPFRQLKYIAVERAKRYMEYGPLPHPISSGYAGALIDAGSPVFFQLKSTTIYNDLYWLSPQEDPLVALLAAHERSQRPIVIVPMHFLWDKRPEGGDSVAINLLPNFIRRAVVFWKNYKNHAVVKFGTPLDVNTLTADCPTLPINERARLVRARLLDILQQEKKVTTGPALKPRSWMINELLNDDVIQKEAYEVSLEKNTPVDDVKALARRYANEIAADVKYRYVEVSAHIMKWAINRIHDGIALNQDGLSLLKKAAQRAPIILVPNHRSHMDYLLLSLVLYENNVSIPHVAAGINLKFWPLGHIFRRCGAFFIRRSFGGNRLYRAVFKAYLKLLLREGYCQEFFIEGGRTRTGKLLKPRMGMLRALCEAMDEGAAEEAFFVPVSITYDQVIEEYKKEIDGDAKSVERTRDLLNLGRHYGRRYGKIYLQFGTPITYSAFRGAGADKLPMLANSIMHTLNRGMVVTPTAVAASALLVSPRRGSSHDAVLNNADELLKYLRFKEVRFSDTLERDANEVISDALNKFVRAKKVKRHDEFDPVCYEMDDDGRAYLDYYKNNIVHYFVSAGCVATIILSNIGRGKMSTQAEEILEPFLFLKKFFVNDFFFSTRMDALEHIRKVLGYFGEQGMGADRLEIYKGLVANYIEAYYACLMACHALPLTEEKNLLKTVIKCARHLHLLGSLSRPESISTPVFKNALQGLCGLQILKLEIDQKGRKSYSWAGNDELATNLKLRLEELM